MTSAYALSWALTVTALACRKAPANDGTALSDPWGKFGNYTRLHAAALTPPSVAVYDVVLPVSGGHSVNPVILPQPRVELANLLMAPDADDPARPQYNELLRKPPTTYIGSVPFGPELDPSHMLSKEDKMAAPKSPRPLLFAQSSNAYPLINFAHAPRPGTLINGSFPLTEGDDLDGVPEDEHHITRYLIDPPAEEASLIDGPHPSESLPSVVYQNASPWFKLWWFLIGEVCTAIAFGIAIYRWGFTKAAALAASGISKTSEPTSLLSTPNGEKSVSTPVVRFDGVPDTSSATTTATAESGTPPKKKSTRRRVRGKKKRRNSVGPQLDRDEDEGDEDDEDKGDGTSDERRGDEPNGTGSNGSAFNGFVMLEKPLPAIPRTLSTSTLQDEQERLAISDTVIGYGSHGTVVLKGTWGGRPVAVKRLLSDFVRLASQEVKLLQASDDHPNVIRCECLQPRGLADIRLLPGATGQLPVYRS